MDNKTLHDLKEAHLKIKILIEFIQEEEESSYNEHLKSLYHEAVKITQICNSKTS